MSIHTNSLFFCRTCNQAGGGRPSQAALCVMWYHCLGPLLPPRPRILLVFRWVGAGVLLLVVCVLFCVCRYHVLLALFLIIVMCFVVCIVIFLIFSWMEINFLLFQRLQRAEQRSKVHDCLWPAIQPEKIDINYSCLRKTTHKSCLNYLARRGSCKP